MSSYLRVQVKMHHHQNKLVDVIKLSETNCSHKISCLLAYATKENFLGRIVNGYHADAAHIALVTPKTAQALCQVQNQLNQKQLGLFVFDSFRPLRAVRDFKAFMHEPVHGDYELVRKQIHYPHVEKDQFSILGYVADEVSNHCFGDTIDLSLIDLQTGKLLDMGACFDFFDPISHATATAKDIGQIAYDNRLILSEAMITAGFIPYEKEFWHYEFHEREVETPLDFAITAELQGLNCQN